MNANDVLQLLIQKDLGGRNPIDLACFLGYKNITLFLMTKLGRPQDIVNTEFNIDSEGRTCFHLMGYLGKAENLAVVLNYERECLKKMISDELCSAKATSRLKNLDVVKGKLNEKTYHDVDTVRRH